MSIAALPAPEDYTIIPVPAPGQPAQAGPAGRGSGGGNGMTRPRPTAEGYIRPYGIYEEAYKLCPNAELVLAARRLVQDFGSQLEAEMAGAILRSKAAATGRYLVRYEVKLTASTQEFNSDEDRNKQTTTTTYTTCGE